ncbi:MAG: polyketide cyclase [Cyanobacteria bacterium P01_D01_bin.36]
MKFSHTLETASPAATIWAIWTAVGWWPEWDSELKSAQIEGAFREGATGNLTPKVGPPTKFSISQVVPNQSYTFTTQLLFCRLVVHRFIHQNNPLAEKICFTHEVSFVGPLAFLFYWLLGNRFRQALPGAMQQIKSLAEA